MKIVNITSFILWILFNILIIPINKTNSFWTSYLFTNLSFLIELIILNKTVLKEKELKKQFLNLSIIYISTGYLIIQMIIFILSVILSIDLWPIYIILLGIFIIFSTLSIIGKKEIEKIETNINFIKNITIQIELLIEKTNGKELKVLLEQIRYSDPISHEEVKELEDHINKKIEELEIKLDNKKIDEIKKLLSERNRKLKTLK